MQATASEPQAGAAPPGGRKPRHEYFALAEAALVFVLILLVCYVGLQLYKLRRPPPPTAEGFLGEFYYMPACGSRWPDLRRECHGFSAGTMPAIDVDPPSGLCGGLLGVPP